MKKTVLPILLCFVHNFSLTNHEFNNVSKLREKSALGATQCSGPGEETEVPSGSLNMVIIAVLCQFVSESFVFVSLLHLQSSSTLPEVIKREITKPASLVAYMLRSWCR